jgi:hypothetical protein
MKKIIYKEESYAIIGARQTTHMENLASMKF